jgi:hypothetical protein
MKSDAESRRVDVVIVEDEKEVREGLRYFLGLDDRIGWRPRSDERKISSRG